MRVRKRGADNDQVLQDMLKLLKESVNSSHGERLEAIVIVLM